MASLPGLARAGLRTRLQTTPCSCTCIRPFTSSTSTGGSRPKFARGAPPAARFDQVDWSEGSVAKSNTSRTIPAAPTPPLRQKEQRAAPSRSPSSSFRTSSPARPPTKQRDPNKPRGPPRAGRGPRRPPPPTADDPRLPQKPRLPPPFPQPTVADLDPAILHEYRGYLMNRTGRMPNAAEMEHNLQPWLAKERKKDEALVNRAFFELKRAELKAEKLDIAWEWARRAEEEAGIRRSEDDRAKDVIVRARVLERFQAKAMAKAEREQGRSAPGGWPVELSSKGGVAPKGQGATADKFRAPPKEEEPPPFEAPEWLKHRQKLKQHFPEGWAPPKRISREAMDLLRLLQRSNPEVYSTPVLADRFKISCESVSRILKSQFDLSAEERARREERRLRAAAEKRAEAIAEGKTWAGDFMGERGEMLKLREGGLVSVREARHRVEQEKRKRSEQALEEGQ